LLVIATDKKPFDQLRFMATYLSAVGKINAQESVEFPSHK
jgi:hypothetical protein